MGMILGSYQHTITFCKRCVGSFTVRSRMIHYFCIVCSSSPHLFIIIIIIINDRYLDSGHGGQTRDLDGDEADGWDEGKVFTCASSLTI